MCRYCTNNLTDKMYVYVCQLLYVDTEQVQVQCEHFLYILFDVLIRG